MSVGPKNVAAQKEMERRAKQQLRVRDWYVSPDCDQVARRHQVWGLLGWYHRAVVAPQLGIRGALRRLWWRLSGQRHRILSPWEQLEARAAAIAAMRAAELAEEAGDLESARRLNGAGVQA